ASCLPLFRDCSNLRSASVQARRFLFIDALNWPRCSARQNQAITRHACDTLFCSPRAGENCRIARAIRTESSNKDSPAGDSLFIQLTALLHKVKYIFRSFNCQLVDRVQLMNPILRGWVNYFAVGNASRCFSFVKDWVEKKVQRHLMRARNRQGHGW